MISVTCKQKTFTVCHFQSRCNFVILCKTLFNCVRLHKMLAYEIDLGKTKESVISLNNFFNVISITECYQTEYII